MTRRPLVPRPKIARPCEMISKDAILWASKLGVLLNMGTIPVPHFGVHLDRATYIDVKRRIEDAGIEYVCKPFIRFKDKELEQETFFIKDPHGNHLEIKSYADPDMEYPGWITPRGHPEWGCP